MSPPDLYALLQQGRDEGVYPSARAVVVLAGDTLFDGGVGEAGPTAIFDLASLTKVMATTAVFASLWAEGKVGPESNVKSILPEAALGEVTLEDLLTHRSGLPAWRPLFASVFSKLAKSPVPDERNAAAKEVLAAALSTPAEFPARSRAVYSDLGFILLGHALERVGGAPLDELFNARVAEPLGLSAHFRRLSDAPSSGAASSGAASSGAASSGAASSGAASSGAASSGAPPSTSSAPQVEGSSSATSPSRTLRSLPLPTGTLRPRPPEPGQEGAFTLTPVPSPPGEVDDDNAWALDGVAGHAGLFGTAHDVAGFGQAILEESLGAGRLAPPELWAQLLTRDVTTPDSTRALGFDTPSPLGASAGSRFGPRAVGHLGFTGTSLWIDLDRHLVVALLTNRTALGRAETRQAIRLFRPRFHDAVLDALGVPPAEKPPHG